MKSQKTDIQVSVSDDVLKGVYSNNAVIAHTHDEFVMDFMTVFQPKGILGARVIISPQHAKRLLKALTNNIAMYEQKYGEIAEIEVPTTDFTIN